MPEQFSRSSRVIGDRIGPAATETDERINPETAKSIRKKGGSCEPPFY